MRPRYIFSLLICLLIVGALSAFYSTNFVLVDVLNMSGGVKNVDFISTIPALLVAVDFVLLAMFSIRAMLRPKCFRRMASLYLIYLGVISLIGFVFSILSGIVVYGSFTSDYPFYGYSIGAMILHFALFLLSIILKVIVSRSIGVEDKAMKVNASYALYSGIMFFLVFFAFNRLGAFLFSIEYVSYSTLYMTFPMYIYLLVPPALLLYFALPIIKRFKESEKTKLIYIWIVFAANIVLGGAVIAVGWNNPLFISAVSPAAPLGRIASMPIETIFQITFLFIITIVYAIRQTIAYRKKSREILQ
ncbi:MAG: hypothetical protein J6X29_02545 [Clostridia bacterium]|nr:hypothetical protein [Clostridia bacterium]